MANNEQSNSSEFFWNVFALTAFIGAVAIGLDILQDN